MGGDDGDVMGLPKSKAENTKEDMLSWFPALYLWRMNTNLGGIGRLVRVALLDFKL
jgi:hypothetical protein